MRRLRRLLRRHPSRRELEGFVRGVLPPEEVDAVLAHLVRGCPRCREVTGSFWEAGAVPAKAAKTGEAGGDYGGALAAAARRARSVLDAETEEARRLWAELAPLDGAARRELLQCDSRFHGRAFCELLLGAAADRAPLDPAAAEELAGLAAEAAERLDPAALPADLAAELAADLRARAWNALADARWRMADLGGVEEALAAARSRLAGGAPGRLERASLLDLEASLRQAQGRSEEALRLGYRALALYRRAAGAGATPESPLPAL